MCIEGRNTDLPFFMPIIHKLIEKIILPFAILEKQNKKTFAILTFAKLRRNRTSLILSIKRQDVCDLL